MATDTSSLPLFYSQPRPMQPALHGKLSLNPQTSYGFAAATNAVPLAAPEMAAACRYFPIVFTNGDQPAPLAVLGVRSQQNLFVDADGAWLEGSYIPAYVRRYPFIFMENADRSQLTLCIDEAAPHIVRDGGNPLFDEQGEPTALTRGALEFCRDYQEQHARTMAFARELAQADILVSNRADITLPGAEKLRLDGFKVIDEARFNALPDATFLRWRAAGWLPLVYFHFVSAGAWPALAGRAKPAAQA